MELVRWTYLHLTVGAHFGTRIQYHHLQTSSFYSLRYWVLIDICLYNGMKFKFAWCCFFISSHCCLRLQLISLLLAYVHLVRIVSILLEATSIMSEDGWWPAMKSRTRVSFYLVLVRWSYLHLRYKIQVNNIKWKKNVTFYFDLIMLWNDFPLFRKFLSFSCLYLKVNEKLNKYFLRTK